MSQHPDRRSLLRLTAADRIVASVRRPWFPGRVFPVTRFGAAGDGGTDCTAAFRAAIGACHAAGGGHVIVPAGTFLTGAIHLLSNVDLHLERGATIRFSQDPAAYLPAVFTRWQGIELMNYSPFIYCYGQRNVAVTGAGTLDGQADANHWWNWKSLEGPDFTALEAMADAGTPCGTSPVPRPATRSAPSPWTTSPSPRRPARTAHSTCPAWWSGTSPWAASR
ncbi:MAG: glycoside hydrolase family 28 protein [Gemmatimonadota bacterium]